MIVQSEVEKLPKVFEAVAVTFKKNKKQVIYCFTSYMASLTRIVHIFLLTVPLKNLKEADATMHSINTLFCSGSMELQAQHSS